MVKMKNPVRYSLVDAFTESAFKGNPAAVCLLEDQRDDEWLQSVAAEFNVSVTGYLTQLTQTEPSHPRFGLRYFTPVAEVNLCGHATLAASHYLFTSGLVKSDIIEYSTLSGILTAKKVADTKTTDSLNSENGQAKVNFLVELNFPVISLENYDKNEVSSVSKALSGAPVIDLKKMTTEDLFAVLPSAKHVADLKPEYDNIRKCEGRGVVISGLAPPESGFDFFSRFFCPKLGVNEDPVCGSAHCALVPYWSKKLGKHDFIAYAASPRGGILKIHYDEEKQRVLLRGKAITVMEGSILV